MNLQQRRQRDRLLNGFHHGCAGHRQRRRVAGHAELWGCARLKSRASTKESAHLACPSAVHGRIACMAFNILTQLFGSRNDRLLKQFRKTLVRINALETTLESLSDEALRAEYAAWPPPPLDWQTILKGLQAYEPSVIVIPTPLGLRARKRGHRRGPRPKPRCAPAIPPAWRGPRSTHRTDRALRHWPRRTPRSRRRRRRCGVRRSAGGGLSASRPTPVARPHHPGRGAGRDDPRRGSASPLSVAVG